MTDYANLNHPKIGQYIGEYILLREIGRGGMAIIFEVKHKDHGAHYALKLMYTNQKQEKVTERFSKEYDALSKLQHPNVLRVYERGFHKDLPYFVMELLEGKILREEVKNWEDISPTQRFEKTEKILIQLTNALDYIHQQGLVHRDVTPANIMILNDGTVKLMDFGVVKLPGMDITIVGEVIGTAAYIAPEQIKGERVDARADLYSLGTALYLMLTNRRPFSARTLTGYLNRHLNQKPDPPHMFAPMVPQKLEEACLRLLEKEPQKRFASANHLLYFLEAQGPPSENRIVGRTWEISQIRDAIANVENNQGSLLILEGPEGMGYGSLLKEAGRISLTSDIPCFFCTNTSPDQPAYDGARPILEHLIKQSPNDKGLLSLLGNPEEHFEKWTAFSTVKTLLQQPTPQIVILNRIDQADQGTVELVEYLIRNLTKTHPILFICGLNQMPTQGTLANIISGKTTEVPPIRIPIAAIEVAAVEEWLLLWAIYDERIQPLAQRIHRESEGMPVLINEMIRDLVDKNKIMKARRETLQLTIEEIDAIPLSLPNTVKKLAAQGFASLPKPCQSIALLLATARQPLSQTQLIKASQFLSNEYRLSSTEVNQSLRILVAKNYISQIEYNNERCCELTYYWLRDLLFEKLTPNEKRYYHDALGKSLEFLFRRSINTVVENLAYHFECSGSHGKAYSYLFQAAKKLKRRSLITESKKYLDLALSIEPFAREHMTLKDAEYRLAELLLERSMVSNILGHTDNAKEQASAAERHAKEIESKPLLSKIAIEKSRQARERYDLIETEEALRQALTYANQSGIPKLRILPLYEVGALHWERGNFSSAKDNFKAAQEASRELNDAEGVALASNGLGVLAMCFGQTAEARRYFEQAIQVGKKNGLVEHLVNSRTNLAELHHCIGNFRKGLQLVNESITEAREVRHRHGLAVALRYRAILLGDIGRHVEAEENAKTAMQIQQELRNAQEELSSLVSLVRVLIPLKKFDYASSLLEHGLELTENYDAEGYLPILVAWKAQVLQHQGQRDEALSLMEDLSVEEGRAWHHQQARCFLNISRTWYKLKRFKLAESTAEAALQIADNSGFRFYAMRARQILCNTSQNEAAQKKHRKMVDSLIRSLSANLPAQDVNSFLARNVPPQ